MRIRNYGPLYQLTFLPGLFPVNCYLYETKEELFLIDAGWAYSSRGILKKARKIGKPITKILITHAHSDHLGALDKIKKSFPQAQVYISKRDARILGHNFTIESDEAQTPIKRGVPKNLGIIPDIFLSDGDLIGSLKAVNTAGHTPGHMSFFDEESGILIAGDAWQTQGGLAVAGDTRPLFPFPAWGTWDKATAISSARKLYELAPRYLATGHGKILLNPLGQMKYAIEAAEEALEAKVAKVTKDKEKVASS